MKQNPSGGNPGGPPSMSSQQQEQPDQRFDNLSQNRFSSGERIDEKTLELSNRPIAINQLR